MLLQGDAGRRARMATKRRRMARKTRVEGEDGESSPTVASFVVSSRAS